MSERPRLSNLGLWPSKTQEALEILEDALHQLTADPGESDDEDSINRRLMRFIDAAIVARRRGAGCSLEPPAYEARSAPAPTDAVRVQREFKRPDFVWLWCDDLALDATLSRLEFVVECKRLAPEPFTRRYVQHGVARFTNDTHAYGKDMRSAVMVGYLQEISVSDAVSDVNHVIAREGFPTLVARRQDGDSFAELAHRLPRNYDHSPFALTHLWARWS